MEMSIKIADTVFMVNVKDMVQGALLKSLTRDIPPKCPECNSSLRLSGYQTKKMKFPSIQLECTGGTTHSARMGQSQEHSGLLFFKKDEPFQTREERMNNQQSSNTDNYSGPGGNTGADDELPF